MPSLDERFLVLPVTNEPGARLIIIIGVIIREAETMPHIKNPFVLKILHKFCVFHLKAHSPSRLVNPQESINFYVLLNVHNYV
jgi:hypothetical protein